MFKKFACVLIIYGLLLLHQLDASVFWKKRHKFGPRAGRKQFPWFASLHIEISPYYSSTSCNGNLITQIWIITAETCLNGVSKNAFIKAGFGTNIKNKEEFWINSAGFYVEPGLRKRLALIRLVMPVTLSTRIYPIKLPPKSMSNYYLQGQHAEICSYNKESHTGSHLRYNEIEIQPESECSFSLLKLRKNYCGRSIERRRYDICYGNPGSGVYLQKGYKSHYIIGIVDTESCHKDNGIIEFEPITKHLDWIWNITFSRRSAHHPFYRKIIVVRSQ